MELVSCRSIAQNFEGNALFLGSHWFLYECIA
jgi:hypothetical protein